VSVIAIHLMLNNMAPDDPPIFVAAHTNHALDQLLRRIADFEPEFIRLGGFTTDMEIIKPRTLYEVKNAVKHSDVKGSQRNHARNEIRRMVKEMTFLLGPLTEGKEPLSASLFLEYGVITDHQFESLVNGAKDWVRSGGEDAISGDIAMWLGDERVEAKQRTMPEDFGIEIEEVDLEFEQLREIEAESKMIGDEDYDTLRGSRIVFAEPFTGHKTIGVTQQTVQTELEKRNLWDVPTENRGPVYRYMQRRVKESILAKLRSMACRHAKQCQNYKIGGWEADYNYLKQARIIGMTTTGLSKNRALLQALKPKVVIIEEAAETLEAPIAVACFETLEHLILIGDHRQLRAHCNDEELAIKPFYLGVSMFERLVRNKVEFSQLKRQRRMIPEIRRALNPIYEVLEDHPSVRDRAPVPGMGGVNSFFFTHKARESVDSQMSKVNVEEADLVVSFFDYLVQNGMESSEITVLTFYNGQRKLILRKLREHRLLQGERYFKIVTVDSYQGEENAIVLLSLVRSNERANIGFLEVENRVCVALSRAQRGFYLFGDAPNLCKSSMLWWYVVQAMGKNPCRVGFYLHLTCQRHNERTYVKGRSILDMSEWTD
jgi:helicase required for RNAi-mediated heterochromatin assembly 1